MQAKLYHRSQLTHV